MSFECDGVKDDFAVNEDNFELGDIFICSEVAAKNAKKFGKDLNAELELLTVHGMLHLCGYDHIKDDEAEVMENLEKEILDA